MFILLSIHLSLIGLRVQAYGRLRPMQLMPIIFASCSIKKSLKPYKNRGIQLLDLRNLTRQQESIAGV